MSLARWNPFHELQTLEDEMDRLSRRQLSGASRPEDALTASQFAPPVDVYEDDSKLTIRFEQQPCRTKALYLLFIKGGHHDR